MQQKLSSKLIYFWMVTDEAEEKLELKLKFWRKDEPDKLRLHVQVN
jgi:hypothetical protein